MTNSLAQPAHALPPAHSVREILAARSNALAVLLFIAIYTAFAIEGIISYPLGFVAALGIVYVTFETISSAVRRWFLLFAASICLLSVASAALNGGGYLVALHDGGTFVYNFFIGSSIYLALMQMGRTRIEKTFFIIAVVLVVGSALEVIGLIGPLSDWFRHAVVSGFVYESDLRDIATYGGIRPKFFSSEPSMLGVMLTLALFCWFSALTKPTRDDYLKAVILIVAGFGLIRSPTVLIGPVAYVLMRCVTYPRDRSRMGRLCFWLPPAYVAAVLLLPIVFLFILLTDANPPAYIASTSFFNRVISPYLIVLRVLASHTLFGIGLLNDDKLSALAVQSLGPFGVFMETDAASWANIGHNVANAFWFVFISFGLGGASVLWFLLSRLFKALDSPISLLAVVVVACFTFWEEFSRVNLPSTWMTFSCVLAMCTLRLRSTQMTPRLGR